MFAYRSHPEVRRYQNWAPGDLEDALDFILTYSVNPAIEEHDWRQLGIYEKAGEALIGDCGFRVFAPGQAEIGYTIAPPYQRRGFGSEVVRWLVSYLFEAHYLRRVIARTESTNVGSIRTLKRTGFRLEVQSPSTVEIRGQREAEFVFSILRESWAAER